MNYREAEACAVFCSRTYKAKISESLMGKSPGPRSEATKKKMRKPKSEAHRRAISEGRKRRYAKKD